MQFFLNGRETRLDDFCNDELARAVINSLFSWRRAEESDDLPGTTRQGWWADTFEENDRFGSRLWLLQRAKLTSEALVRAKEYASESLQWLIDDRVASQIIVDSERGSHDQLNLSVVIVKPDGNELAVRFQDVWSK